MKTREGIGSVRILCCFLFLGALPCAANPPPGGSAEAANGSRTIIALQAGTAILAREYWLEDDKVACVFGSGERRMSHSTRLIYRKL